MHYTGKSSFNNQNSKLNHLITRTMPKQIFALKMNNKIN